MPDGTQNPPVAPQSPPVGGGDGVLLTRDAATRARETVRFVERTFLAPPGPLPRRAPRGSVTPARWVRLTAALSARSGANCTSAAAVFLAVSDAGVFSDTSETLTLWNGTDKAFSSGSNRYVLATWANGKWWATVPSSCDYLS